MVNPQRDEQCADQPGKNDHAPVIKAPDQDQTNHPANEGEHPTEQTLLDIKEIEKRQHNRRACERAKDQEDDADNTFGETCGKKSEDGEPAGNEERQQQVIDGDVEQTQQRHADDGAHAAPRTASRLPNTKTAMPIAIINTGNIVCSSVNFLDGDARRVPNSFQYFNSFPSDFRRIRQTLAPA